MLAVAIAFVALMVFEWGMDLTGQSGAQLTGGEIGSVNREAISFEEYNATYRSLYDQQSQFVSGPIGPALTREIEDAAFEQIVMQKLITQELARRGIVVTDEEVRQAARFEPPPSVRSDPAFLTDGQFDLAKYHSYMSSPAVPVETLLALEAYYRGVIPQTKLYFQQTSGIYVPDEQLWRMWRDTRDSVTVRYLAFDPSARIPDEGVSVSENEIRAFYDENKDDFVRPARATVKFVTIDARPNAADTAAALERVQRLRSEIDDGADFAEIAAIESADSLSAQEGGLVTVQRGQTAPALDKAVFSTAIGTLSEPIQSQFGYHLIRVESRSGDEAEFRHIMIPIELSYEHEDDLFVVADSIDALSETLTLDAIGTQLGLTVQEADLLPGLVFLPGIGQADDGADWVFNEAEAGEVSEVFETPQAFYAVELVSRDEERSQTIDEARATIRTALIIRKKVDRTMQIARDAVDRIRGGESLEAVAGSVGVEVREAGPFARSDVVPGLGQMNAAIGTAFGLQPGEISGAIDADRQVYIIQTLSRTDASREAWEEQKATQRAQVGQALAQQRWEDFLTALREDARVVDSRAELQRQQDELQRQADAAAR
jgi:parvulin-like peptidyl-prolyl isomerase